ncbi:surface protease GP63 [Trypanosoma cruzi cruzi]|nr:surface protease GP63 [Trypanosoma cruzi cruzi]
MHQPRQTTLLFTRVIFLLLFCAGVCLATDPALNASSRCIFDALMKKYGRLPTAVVRELPRRGQGAVQAYTAASEDGDDGWAPIRFKVFTEDLNNPQKYCTAEGEQRSDLRGIMTICRRENILTEEKKNIFESYVIPKALKMHSDRLFVKPLRISLVVPDPVYGICTEFTIPREHRTKGVPNTDMVIYAGAAPVTGAAAWAGPCLTLRDGRPFVAVLNYDPRTLLRDDATVRQTAHEVAHALGFGYDIMEPLGMVSRIPNVRGKEFVTVVSSAITKEKTREHYNCPTAPGMELEDEGYGGTAGSHWERRNALDELMAGISGASLYTSLTMSAFESMGFYRANWGMEEDMAWGRDAGCALLERKCIENGVSVVPDMFCANATPPGQLLCTASRRGLGSCGLYTYSQSLPIHFQYFSDSKAGGGNDYVDFCPYIHQFSNTGCIDGDPQVMRGSHVGPNSRCVKGDSLETLQYPVGDICVDTFCENGAVKVRYLGAEAWEPCPEGGHITPNATFYKGRIICPRHADVCPRRGIKGNGLDDSCVVAAFGVPLSFLIALLCVLAVMMFP